MKHDQHGSRRDRVFNAETCRALRRVSRSRMAVFAFVVVLGFSAIWAMGSLLPTSALLGWLGVAYLVAVISAGLWALLPPREVRREVMRALVWHLARKFDREHALPAEYRPLSIDDDRDPESFAVPSLAFGRGPRDWALVIGVPAAVAVRLAIMPEVPLGVALGGCIIFGGVLLRVTRGGFFRSTYHPEDPPPDRRTPEAASPNPTTEIETVRDP